MIRIHSLFRYFRPIETFTFERLGIVTLIYEKYERMYVIGIERQRVYTTKHTN